MGKSELKVIFFDAGGVLFKTHFGHEDRIRNLMMERDFTREQVDSAIQKGSSLRQRLFSKDHLISNWEEEWRYWQQYYSIVAEALGNAQLMHELYLFTHFANHCELYPEVKKVLNALSPQYRLGVISNALPSMDGIFDRLRVRKYFEVIVISAFVRVSKPNAGIYEQAAKLMGASEKECLFIDDRMGNIEGAEKVGMRALHLDRKRYDLEKLLRGEGIL